MGQSGGRRGTAERWGSASLKVSLSSETVCNGGSRAEGTQRLEPPSSESPCCPAMPPVLPQADGSPGRAPEELTGPAGMIHTAVGAASPAPQAAQFRR